MLGGGGGGGGGVVCSQRRVLMVWDGKYAGKELVGITMVILFLPGRDGTARNGRRGLRKHQIGMVRVVWWRGVRGGEARAGVNFGGANGE